MAQLWLRSPQSAEPGQNDRIETLTVIAAITLIIESLVLTLAVHWLFALFIAGGVAIIYPSRQQEKPTRTSKADLAVEEYSKLGH